MLRKPQGIDTLMMNSTHSAVTVSPQEMYRTLFEQASDGIFIADSSGRYLDVNSRGCEMTGYSHEELLQLTLADLVPAEDLIVHPFKIDELKSGMPVMTERRLMRKDGTFFLAEISARMLSDGNMLGIVRDVSERRTTIEQLRASEERYRSLFDANPHPMWVYDLETLRFLAVNDAAIRKYGYSREEFLSMTIKEIRPEEDIPRLLSVLANLDGARIPELRTWRHKKRGGAIIQVEISSHMLVFDGRRAMLVLAHDVTERRRAEARVMHLSRLYEMLSQVNESIVRVSSQDELYHAICKATVEHGRFRMAWIGLIDATTGHVKPYMHYGHEEGYLANLAIPTGDKPAGRGPTGTAIREGRLVTCDDIATDPRMALWRDAALARGYYSSAAVPFRLRGKVIGSLNLYASEAGFFADDEKKLLEDIGTDISFALDTLAAEEERHLATEALLAAEEKFRTLVEQIPAVVYLAEADDNSSTHYVSPLIHSMTGYTQEEWMSNPRIWADSIHPEDKDRVKTEYSHSRRSKIPFVSEYRLRRKDDRYIWVRDEARILPNPHGGFYVQGVMLNITEQKQADSVLREKEERFRTTLYSIGDGVITTDTEGRIVQMNPVAEELTGWTEAEAIGKPVNEILNVVHEATEEPLENPVARVMAEGTVVGLASDAVLISRSGIRRPISDSGAPIRNAAGATTGVVIVFNDQTERKSLEAQLLQAQKMEAIGRLAGGIAHDFNNMTGIILGYADILVERLRSENPELLRNAEAIVTASNRAASLTRQLLAFARKQVASPVPTNLNTTLESLQGMLGRLIGEDIVLHFDPAPSLWSVKIDPSQLDQILTNLITNSRDAIQDVGMITLETSNVVIDEAYSNEHVDAVAGEYVLLAVSDTGKGMDKETVTHIFEPFFTTKPKGEGTGLGLSTVFGIVKQNGGFITVYSEPGHGTTVKIYLPHHAGEIFIPVQSPKPEELTHGTETILLVEDELQLLELTKEGLEMQGYTVLAASDPAEALRICSRHIDDIDLVVTDVVMPGMNGREMAERIRAMKPGMKMIFVSGYTANIVAQRGIVEDGFNFVPKPYTPRTLLGKVRGVLDGTATLDAETPA